MAFSNNIFPVIAAFPEPTTNVFLECLMFNFGVPSFNNNSKAAKIPISKSGRFLIVKFCIVCKLG